MGLGLNAPSAQRLERGAKVFGQAVVGRGLGDGSLYERVVIQQHPITFATVDLSGPAAAILHLSPIRLRKK
jgi:hypothetical protein